MYKKLFSPIKIKGLELKNRVVFPAMGTKFSGKDRYVTKQLIDYHVARVKGGNGLNFVEVASVHTPSAPRGFLSLSEDCYIDGLKELTDAIHKEGGKACVQLWQGSLAAGFDRAAVILLPSPKPVSPTFSLPGMTTEQITEMIACYGKAAKRAVAAGFDCVEIHAGHNYLIHSFLSPAMNKREDEYGGTFEKCMKFPLEVIKEIRANIPEDMPIFMRIVAHDDYLEGGLTIENTIEFCKKAQEFGVDVLDVSRGNIVTAGLKYEVPPIDIERAFNIGNAIRIKEETGMITMGVGRLNTPEIAEEALLGVDLVGIGRGQLADPDFCNKAMSGNADEIILCIGCNQGCYDSFADKSVPFISCMRNPAVGREAEYALVKTDKAQKVMIAGGGIAGMELALTLKKRGHIPFIYEASDHLGGQLITAGEAPRKEEMKQAAEHMAKLVFKEAIEVHLETPVNAKLIEEVKPDTFFNAIGAEEIVPNIEGVDGKNVYMSHDVLSGRANISGSVVVIGGGLVGLEVGEYLVDKGCQITILEMLPEVGSGLGSIRKICAMENIHKSGMKTVTDSAVTLIKDNMVIAKAAAEDVEYPCDAVVIAIGSKSRDGKELEAKCRELGIAYFVVGDAAKARRALNATFEAARLARVFDDPAINGSAKRPKKTVFFTGATGNMGVETLKQFILRGDRFNARILVRPSNKNKELLQEYMSAPNLEIVWGDMTDKNIINRCVQGADYVLHIGAMVSPAADKYPEETMITNYGSTLSIIEAIKAQPNADDIGLVYIGTVAQTGCRMGPIHWGRCGDPIKPSMFDTYAVSKVISERAIFESGLKKWVSLRQTGIVPPDKSAAGEPIIFHQNPNNVIEWVTAIDSGILMANVCEGFIPESFWRKCYNIGGGKDWRFVHWQFVDKNMEPLGATYSEVYDPRDCALFNFHGQWYTDSDDLNNITRFRNVPPEAYYAGYGAEITALRANPMIRAQMPNAQASAAKNKTIAKLEMGPDWMIENDKYDWITAFFGSKEKKAQIKSTEEGYEYFRPSETPTYLNHGYDESKPVAELDIADMKQAAEFRGGKCLSNSMTKGDLYTKIKWSCAFNHEFEATPNLILKAGHWCPHCEKESWNFAEIAKTNPFFAQVWTPIHGDEDAITIKKVSEDLVK